MQSSDDIVLLRQYLEDRSDGAFALLVKRHINLIYSVALRHAGDPHKAEEITQAVFILLARKAVQLRHDKALSSWLFQATRLTASNAVRTETRRHRREQEAHMQSVLDKSGSDIWQQIAPLLDTAVANLSEKDREAIVLRFYEGRNLREVGEALGASEDAAEKRVSRAVERLREFFARRGVTVGASGLAVAITANSVQAAPVGLAVTISTAAALAGTTLAATATATAIKTIAMTTLQKTIIGVALAAAVGTGVYEARQASTLRDQVQTLQQQQAPLTEQIQQSSQALSDAANQIAALHNDNERLNRNTGELLRLRAEVSSLRQRTNAREILTAKNLQPAPPATDVRAEEIAKLKAKWGEAKTNWLASAENVRKFARALNVPDEITTNVYAFTNRSTADHALYQPYFEAVEERDRQARWVDINIRRVALLELETDPTETPPQ